MIAGDVTEGLNRVRTESASEHERVVAIAAIQYVIACAANQDVIAIASLQLIVAAAALQNIVRVAAYLKSSAPSVAKVAAYGQDITGCVGDDHAVSDLLHFVSRYPQH